MENPTRPLSAEGNVQIGRLASFVRPLGIHPGEVWHSGKARAEETARILINAVAEPAPLVARPGLMPDDSPCALLPELGAASRDLMIVGHLPFLPVLAALLLTRDASRELFLFRTGTMACLRRSSGELWHLEWMVHPELVAAGSDGSGAP